MVAVRVKICGLTRIEDVREAIDSGADALGFIFGHYSSPRNLSLASLVELTREVPPYVGVVVVSPASNLELSRVIGEVRPSFLQISSYNEEELDQLYFQPNVVKTIHLGTGDNQDRESIISKCKNLSKHCKGILLDSALIKPKNSSQEKFPNLGGSGTTHNWNLSRRIRDELHPFPIILAGGLNDQNVQRAIEIVEPYAVDVSSGVESTPGIKDKMKVRKFIQNAKAGYPN
jgi:phosphoribosylanthranilate isomerase